MPGVCVTGTVGVAGAFTHPETDLDYPRLQPFTDPLDVAVLMHVDIFGV